MIGHIIHFNVVCTDLERSMNFYCDMLGGKLDRDPEEALGKTVAERGIDNRVSQTILGFDVPPEWRATCVRFGEDENATYINLQQWIEPASYGKPYDRMIHVGIPRTSLACDDVDKAYNDLRANGVEFINPPVVMDLKRGRGPFKAAVCKDPDGIAIELVEFISLGFPSGWRKNDTGGDRNPG